MKTSDVLTEKTTDTRRIFDGNIINLRVDSVILPNGRDATREVVEHRGGVCILPINNDGNIYMVRQYRYPFNDILLEAPAGKLDNGELPIDAANRELEEEVGYKAGELTYLGKIYPSVGFLTEVLHLYVATNLIETKQHLDDDEFLHVETYKIDCLYDMIMRGEICDAKTIIIILKAKALLGL